MFDYIGEKIRAGVLANLPWISRAAGYTEPAAGVDSGSVYPAAMPYDGQPCDDAADLVNMAPQQGDTALAFVDSDYDVRVVSEGGRRRQEIETFFRVVVWYDTRKITIDAGHLATGLQMAITAGVQAIDFNTDGLQGVRVNFYSYTDTPERIWARYRMADDRGLFMLPYRTFALTYRLTARYAPECFTGQITADADAC